MAGRPTVLILGGTADAAALARLLVAAHGETAEVVSSLAGRTASPAAVAGSVRVGGFGGPDALAAYLHDNAVRAVVDATHPFAAAISENARIACAAAGVPRLALVRPPWTPSPGDDWHEVADMAAAASALPRFGRRAFLTVGRQELDAFAACPDMWFLVRLVDPPTDSLPLPDFRVVTGRGPFDAEAECNLMVDHKINVLVCKASGGAATQPKLQAARRLGLPVVMVARPALPAGACVDSVAAAADWVAGELT
jgi:precorrin-6A/cobalt-precorrin-6A reductase